MSLIAVVAMQTAFLCRFDQDGDQIFGSVLLALFASLLLCYVLNALLRRIVHGRDGSRRKIRKGNWLVVCLCAVLGIGILYLVVSTDYQVFQKQAGANMIAR